MSIHRKGGGAPPTNGNISAEPKPVWYRVEAPHFVAGIKFNGQKCVDAAPILSWCFVESKDKILHYFKRKGYKVEGLK